MRFGEKSWKGIFAAAMHLPPVGHNFFAARFQLAKATLTGWETGYAELQRLVSLQRPDGLIPLASNTLHSQHDLEDLLYPPTLGFALLKIYRTCPDKVKAKQILSEFFPRILYYHHYIYENRDFAGDGLIPTRFPYESPNTAESSLLTTIQDADNQNCKVIKSPLFNSLLVLSNDSLIKLAGLLGRDVSQLLNWNELTIHSMNEQLWDPVAGQYQIYDMGEERFTPTGPMIGATPLVAQIPDQQQAHALAGRVGSFDLRTKTFPNNLTMELFCSWLVAKGFKNYRLKSIAQKIKKSTYQKTIRRKLSEATYFRRVVDCRKTRESFDSLFFRLN